MLVYTKQLTWKRRFANESFEMRGIPGAHWDSTARSRHHIRVKLLQIFDNAHSCRTCWCRLWSVEEEITPKPDWMKILQVQTPSNWNILQWKTNLYRQARFVQLRTRKSKERIPSLRCVHETQEWLQFLIGLKSLSTINRTWKEQLKRRRTSRPTLSSQGFQSFNGHESKMSTWSAKWWVSKANYRRLTIISAIRRCRRLSIA